MMRPIFDDGAAEHPAAKVCLALGLQRAEGRLLLKLAERGHASRPALHVAISGSAPKSTIRIVDVVIHRLRQKLAREGVKISTIRGIGYMVDEASRDNLRELLHRAGCDEGIAVTATPPANRKDAEQAA